MEIVVTAFAAVVAAGCFLAILSSDLKKSGTDEDSSGQEKMKSEE